MAGLWLGGMGGVSARSGGWSSSPAPATASQAAFGTGASSGGYPSTWSAIAPNDPFGVALWLSVGAAVVLVALRHGLPA